MDAGMYDAAALGELLIDFTPGSLSDKENVLFEQNPGGAPANVMAALSKLGKKTAFLGKVGNDPFGRFLTETLQNNGIDTGGVVLTNEVNTTLAFVHLQPQGERSFFFYRNPGADQMYRPDEIDFERIRQSRLLHFGSVSMTDRPSRDATLQAVRFAKKNGKVITYDPNLRKSLWGSIQEAEKVMAEGLVYADLLKVSEEELYFLSGSDSLHEGTGALSAKYGTPLILVTLGDHGCFYLYKDVSGIIPGYRVDSIDATGAGDAFFGAAIFKFLEQPGGFSRLAMDDIGSMLRFANAAGALATTKKGAIPSLPDIKEIKQLMETQPSPSPEPRR